MRDRTAIIICAHDQIRYFIIKIRKSRLANEGEEVEERQRGRTRGQVCSLHLNMYNDQDLTADDGNTMNRKWWKICSLHLNIMIKILPLLMMM